MKEEIYKLIHERDHVTYAELMRIDGARGDFEISLETVKGPVIFWSGVSEEFAKALNELKKENRIDDFPTSLLTYLVDGEAIDLPVFTTKKSKKLRWCPLVFRSIENINKKK